MNIYRFYLILAIASASIMMVSCGKKTGNTCINPVNLDLDTTISELGDSSFIPQQIRCMECTKDFLYYTDYAGGMVILDKNYQIIKELGSRGQGPGEILGAAHFCLAGNDSVYILNEGKRSIEMFVNGNYSKTITFPKNTRFTFNTRFFANKGKIVHSVINKEFPVVAFNKDTTYFMCSYTPYDDPLLGRHATKHVLKGDNSFYLIGCVYPTLEEYNMNGEIVKDFDLSVVPEISQMIEAYESAPKDPGSYFTVIEDVYYHQNNLYLLIANLKGGNYHCNTIAVIDVSESEWKYKKCFYLSGKVYDTFCVDDQKVYLHDPSRACLDVFRLVN